MLEIYEYVEYDESYKYADGDLDYLVHFAIISFTKVYFALFTGVYPAV